MTYIPNCRENKYYNQKYLNEKDKEFIAGYDYAVEQIVNLIENNVEVYPDLELILADNVAIIEDDKNKIVADAIKDWAEMDRNELITSMIDGYENLEAIKAEVDANEDI